MQRQNFIISAVLFLLGANFLYAQTFTKDMNNLINQTPTDQNYSGAAWIDFDNDGDLDLFATKNHLFINNGDGTFSYEAELVQAQDVSGTANGNSWADFNNDGNLDLALSGSPISLFKNTSEGFMRIVEGNFNPELNYRGWAPAWGDYNNDGFVDLFVTHANLFHGNPSTPSFLFINNGDGRFTKDEKFLFSQELAPYTIPTWSDYDLDGDLDLLIGSGPANGTTARDYIFVNQLVETGLPDLIRLETEVIGADLQNGQTYNTVDFDNDGDFDIHLTNYGGVSDRLYANNEGTYEEITFSGLTIEGNNLGANWGDTDNDGDQDVIITSESENYFFKNNSDGSFTEITDNGIKQTGGGRGATFGDYDDDGDLDIFISGRANARGLYENKNDNKNNWIKFYLEGTISNKAAIGAKVRLKSTINGVETWQLREVLSQNSFGAHNSLIVHFGLGDASVVDEVIIDWPSGQTTNLASLSVNTNYNVEEEIPTGYLRSNFGAETIMGYGSAEINFIDLSITDPNDPISSWEWDFDNDGVVDATVQNPAYNFEQEGNYTVKLTVANSSNTESFVRENYITVKPAIGVPVILSTFPSSSDTTIGKTASISFQISAEDTSGYEIDYVWTKNGQSVSTNSTYNYTSTVFFPTPRTDTIKVVVSNEVHSASKTWLVNVVDDPTGVEEDKKFSFDLKQNYPNPFNPSTGIKYTIPERTAVTLKVYGILGDEVATLIDMEQNSGVYNVYFNAENLSSGIYLYTLIAGNHKQTRKMLLIK